MCHDVSNHLNIDRDMNRDKILKKTAGAALRRSAPSALTSTLIAALKPGCSLADGAIRPGAGSLKIRKRETARGLVTEWLFEWTRDGKTVRQSLGRFALKEVAGSLTLAQARAVASGLQETVRSGESPLHKRNMEREAAQAREAVVATKMRDAGERTLGALLSTYISSLEKRGKKTAPTTLPTCSLITWSSPSQNLQNYLPFKSPQSTSLKYWRG